MADDSSDLSGSEWWKAYVKEKARFPKTLDAVGKRCAVEGCPVTRGISYSKPLCYGHWKLFDRLDIDECERCHWFEEGPPFEDQNGILMCFDCQQRQYEGASPAVVYAHDKIERRIRYLYFLKLSNGHFYIGQTVSNQQKWDTMEAERSGVGRGSGELPEGPVVASSLFHRLSLHLLSAL